jgi:hypothetical protein
MEIFKREYRRGLRHYDVWYMGYGGFCAAIVPGMALAIYGAVAIPVALAISVAFIATSPSARNGLKDVGWYRWYVGLPAVASVLFGSVRRLSPDWGGLAAIAWGTLMVAIVVGFYESLTQIDGQEIGQAKSRAGGSDGRNAGG